MRLALEAVDLAGRCGLLDAVEDGEVHTAHGVALGAYGRWDEAIPELERGVFLRRLWGQQLDLVDGLIELGTGLAAAGERIRAIEAFDEAQELLARCRSAGALPARLAAARRAARSTPAPADALTDRELAVLRLLRSGLSEREIGRELYVSFNTVHSHVKAIYRKLGVTSRAEAVERAAHLGEISRRG
jgi:LuxR family maltose regulon positive regulatory protein